MKFKNLDKLNYVLFYFLLFVVIVVIYNSFGELSDINDNEEYCESKGMGYDYDKKVCYLETGEFNINTGEYKKIYYPIKGDQYENK